MPRENQLPHEIKELAHRNGIEVRHTTFDSDMERLVSAIDAKLGVAKEMPRLFRPAK